MLNSAHNRKYQEKLKRHQLEIRPTLPPLMTTTAKPKAKFSSRNLSAVFKAPLRSKPLPDHAAGPLQRPNSRMLVLGRAAAAPPAPINTPSLKRESQVHDAHVSLVPAGSNWAENAHKQQNPEDSETSESAPISAEVEAPAAVSEQVWTPESVAEHLHTASAAARPKVAAENSGRWGDDAVEHDIFRNNVRRQMQKEREFPDLKGAVEDAQMHHGQGHASAADRSHSMGPQQAEQHHGRATGRWAHFGEQEEMHRPLHDDRWSRDRYGEDDRWSRGRYGRDDDERWSRDRYSRDEDDRCSRGRYDDGSGRERRLYESDNSAISPAPNDSHTHFSRSDARFDMVASGDRDRVLSHSPHRMDWSSGRLGRRSERSSSPAPLHGPEGSRLHTPRPHRSLTQSPASASPSPSPTTPPLAADATPARAMNWHSLTSADREPERAWRAQHRTDEPSTPVAETAKSNTDSSSNSCASSSPIRSQQVQLLKRPKMLFDPKTGAMVRAEDKASSSAAKRQSSRSGGKPREAANTPTIQLQSTTKPSNTRKPEAESKTASPKTNNSEKPGCEEKAPVAVIAVITVQEVGSETSSSISSGAVLAEQVAGSAKKECARATAKRPAPRATKSKRDPRSKQSTMSQTQQRPNPPNAASDTRAERGKHTATSTRNDRRATGGNTPSSGHMVQFTSAQKVAPTEVALLKQIAEGANGNVVRITEEKEGIEVSQEEDGFETVKSRRVVLSEKKKLRQRLASGEAAARAAAFVDEKNNPHAPASEERGAEQSKGEEVRETFGTASKQVDTQLSSKPRGKASKDSKQKQAKQSRPRAKEYKQKVVSEQPVVKPAQSEQVAGEAPAESPLPKKKSQSAKATTEAKRELQPRKQNTGHPSRKSSDRKETADAAERKKKTGKRQSTGRANGDPAGSAAQAVEKVPAAKASKARPKQVRKVYVVKTPAPTAVPNATSTA
ncbi:hypothetical protein PRIC1_001628 [Phytophthora ramorum]